jgi:hypothetical protein
MDEPTESLGHRLTELTGIVLADETLEAALGHVAFERLRVMSQQRSVELRDLAEALVEARDDLVHG